MDGKGTSIPREHPNFVKIVDAVRAKEYDTLASLLDVKQAMYEWGDLAKHPDFTITDGLIVLNGEAFEQDVSEKALRMMRDGQEPDALFNMLRKLRKNPSRTAQKEVLFFFVANNMLIHEDGDIIAYKSVTDDYLDVHSGTVLNKPAHLFNGSEPMRVPYTTTDGVHVAIENGVTVVSMARHKVDDNRERTCSVGLHFAAYEYASTWAGSRIRHVVVMKVNPADIVSIPSDYRNQKGRCSRYEIIGERTDFTPLPHREVYTSDFGFSNRAEEFMDEEEEQFASWDYDEDDYADDFEEEFDDEDDDLGDDDLFDQDDDDEENYFRW